MITGSQRIGGSEMDNLDFLRELRKTYINLEPMEDWDIEIRHLTSCIAELSDMRCREELIAEFGTVQTGTTDRSV